MGSSKKSLRQAEVSGAREKNPQRYRNIAGSKGLAGVGDPYDTMTQPQRAVWVELRSNLPWLTQSDRVFLRLCCVFLAQCQDAESLTPNSARCAMGLLAKLGATPIDVSRIDWVPADEDPASEFFH